MVGRVKHRSRTPGVTTFALLATLYLLLSKASAGTVAPTVPYAEGEAEPEGEPEVEPEVISEDSKTEPEGEPGNLTQICLFVSLYVIIIIIILVGNIIVALTILSDKTLHGNVSNLYLLSLVTARASIAVFVIPARITGMFSEEYLGSILCRLCHFAAFGSHTASIFSIAAIAISKYIAITYEKKTMTMKQSVLVILLIWFFGFLYAIRAAVTNDLVIVTSTTGLSLWSCTTAPQYRHMSQYFVLVDMFCLFLIPLVIIVFCYSRVINKLSTFVISSKGGASVSVVDKQSQKAVRMLVILMVLFAICTMAPMLLNLYVLWGGERFESYPVVETVIYMFSYSNSWFNLIVFAIFRDDLRSAFKSMIRRSRCYPKSQVTPIMVVEEIHKALEKQDPQKQEALRMMEF